MGTVRDLAATELRAWQGGGFRLALYACPKDSEVPEHAHDTSQVWLALKGRALERVGTVSVERAPGTVTALPPGVPHGGRWLSAGRIVTLESTARSLTPEPRWERGGALHAVLRLGAAELSRPDTNPLVLEGLCLQASGEAQRIGAERGTPSWLLRARELVDERALETLTIMEVAAEVGVHPSHLARSYRRRFGATIPERVLDLRVKAACRHLEGGGFSIGEIALLCGYSDQSHFTAAFRRRTGQTPRAYRLARSSRAIFPASG